jgi:NAD(P)-dependent dehydrogenase (short-subunit alcohol dehydrogenase family)
MQALTGKVAVVTGGASGIGRAMADRFAREGMKIVLADIEEPALSNAASELTAAGAQVIAVRTDVSKSDQVDSLADAAYQRFGAVHVLCNNAGVAPEGAPVWMRSLDTWHWLLGVNLYGVIHGIRSFVPRMLAQGEEGHVVNTASIAGLSAGPMIGPYFVSKHAVVSLSETLYLDLKLANAKLGVSVLCPAFVKTNIGESARNRPSEIAGDGFSSAEFHAMVRAMIESGIPASAVADQVVDAILKDQFWILTHPESKAMVRDRMTAILEGANPAGVGEISRASSK